MCGCVSANVSDKTPTPLTASHHEDTVLFCFVLVLGTTEAHFHDTDNQIKNLCHVKATLG